MSPKITLHCPGCNARIKAPAEMLGQRRNCPGCGTAFYVRPQPLQDSDPMLVTASQLVGDKKDE
jgi:uncharacterized paraquat-inducible protein A